MLSRLKFDIADLANEILDQFPKSVFESSTTTFCDPCIGGGQLIAAVESRLRAYGHSDANIASRVFGFSDKQMEINFAKHKYNLAAQLNIYKLDESEINMKFDVTLTNPPYQHPTNGRWKLWIQFMERSFDVVSEGGYVAFICPTSWIHCTEHQRELYKAKVLLSSKNLTAIGDVDDNVFKVGEKIGYFIAENVEADSSSAINDRLTIGGKIISRIIGNSYQFTTRLTTLKDKVEKSDITCYHSAANNFPIADSTKHRNQRCPKIIMNVSGNYSVTAFGPDVISGRHGRAMLFDTMEEAQLAADTMNMKLFKFSVCETKTGGFNNEAMLPHVDLSRPWTDDELYAHFGLTQEEIDYVEANV